MSFDYSCGPRGCAFLVGNTSISDGSTSPFDFVTVSPTGFNDITSLVFSGPGDRQHRIDNIVLSYNDLAAIPVPAALPLLLTAFFGLAAVARGRRKSA